MNTREMADKLGTDPKRLRRFLRADPTYRNAGQGGRYEFAERDVATLRKRFDVWLEKTIKAAAEKTAAAPRRSRGEIQPMPARIANVPAARLTRSQREERDRISKERVDRLESRLIAAGLHVSQMKG